MAKELNKEEIKERLIRLRNLEMMYARQKNTITLLKKQIKLLKKENTLIKSINEGLVFSMQDMKLQIEELRVMVFGKKKKKRDKEDDDISPPKQKIKRTAESYKRPIPKEDEITETVFHTSNFCSCGHPTTKKKTVVYYEEDIPLPAKKTVKKHTVEKAYCPMCRKWNTAVPLPTHRVIIGTNTQKYICYLSIMTRLSFSKIQDLLSDTYSLNISQGEISKILERESIRLRPFYEQLKEKIRGEPAIHLDETGWKIFIGDGYSSYSWIMSGGESKESVFLVGENRGKGNVEKLTGDRYKGVVVTDDYGAYRKLKNHQLCWAHLIRKFRDLATSGEVEERVKVHCKEEYRKLCLIFVDLKNDRRIENYDEFTKKLAELAGIHPDDPKKMIQIGRASCRERV